MEGTSIAIRQILRPGTETAAVFGIKVRMEKSTVEVISLALGGGPWT